MAASIHANNRIIAPFGVAGGKPGQSGRNWVEGTDGREKLRFAATIEHQVENVFVIETSGGGGFGLREADRLQTIQDT